MSNARIFCWGALAGEALVMALKALIGPPVTGVDPEAFAIHAMLMGGSIAVAAFGDRRKP